MVRLERRRDEIFLRSSLKKSRYIIINQETREREIAIGFLQYFFRRNKKTSDETLGVAKTWVRLGFANRAGKTCEPGDGRKEVKVSARSCARNRKETRASRRRRYSPHGLGYVLQAVGDGDPEQPRVVRALRFLVLHHFPGSAARSRGRRWAAGEASTTLSQ